MANHSELLKKCQKLWDTSWTPCKLNSECCLSLDLITSSFSAPITEEHAWAIVFECVKCLQEIVERHEINKQTSSQRGRKCSVFVVTSTQHIYLHRDGRIHASTFLQTQDSSSSKNYFFVFSGNYFDLLGKMMNFSSKQGFKSIENQKKIRVFCHFLKMRGCLSSSWNPKWKSFFFLVKQRKLDKSS